MEGDGQVGRSGVVARVVGSVAVGEYSGDGGRGVGAAVGAASGRGVDTGGGAGVGVGGGGKRDKDGETMLVGCWGGSTGGVGERGGPCDVEGDTRGGREGRGIERGRGTDTGELGTLRWKTRRRSGTSYPTSIIMGSYVTYGPTRPK